MHCQHVARMRQDQLMVIAPDRRGSRDTRLSSSGKARRLATPDHHPPGKSCLETINGSNRAPASKPPPPVASLYNRLLPMPPQPIREGPCCAIQTDVMEKAYARWAPIYDALCGPVFVNGRRAAASAAREVGGGFWRSASAPACHSTITMRRHRNHRHRHFGADDRQGAQTGVERTPIPGSRGCA